MAATTTPRPGVSSPRTDAELTTPSFPTATPPMAVWPPRCSRASVARQAVVSAPGTARLSRPDQPLRLSGALVVDRGGARSGPLLRAPGLARGGGLALGRPGGSLVARAPESRHRSDRSHRRRASTGTRAAATSTPARRSRPALSGWFPQEPLWVDLRWARGEQRRIDAQSALPRQRGRAGGPAARPAEGRADRRGHHPAPPNAPTRPGRRGSPSRCC